MRLSEPAPAKLNLALHVRGKRPDGRHELETIFAFCTDGDILHLEAANRLSLEVTGPFAAALAGDGDNLVLKAAEALAGQSGVTAGAALTLVKKLPVASGIGGGSADAAAGLRLLTRLWGIDPAHAQTVAPSLGADVPACLLSMTARGSGAGDEILLFEDPAIANTPVLLVNPRIPVSTGAVFAEWDGIDRGPLGDWRTGRNDLEKPARQVAAEIGDVLKWLAKRQGTSFVRMSGSGATCFAIFETEQNRDLAAAAVPPDWWHLATFLR